MANESLTELVEMAGRAFPLQHCECDTCRFARASRKWFLALGSLPKPHREALAIILEAYFKDAATYGNPDA